MAHNQEYEVDGVHGWKVENGQSTYATKWTGFGYDQMTWEPFHHLANIHDLLHTFHGDLQQYGPSHVINGPGYWMALRLPAHVALYFFAAPAAIPVTAVVHYEDDSDDDSDGEPQTAENMQADSDYDPEHSDDDTDSD
ncbi:hypothetical protein AAVH_27514 [Aphelenchoides avenae]|nr:hypothetical protein AAVH_27514 [Aphelenchus avenae]